MSIIALHSQRGRIHPPEDTYEDERASEGWLSALHADLATSARETVTPLHRGLPIRGWHPSMPLPLQIQVRTGTGRGATPRLALEAARRSAGVGDFNLVRLSSVIPAGAAIDDGITPRDRALPASPPAQPGDRLHVVMSEARASRAGVEAWAGIGWVQEPTTGKGMFVEQDGPKPDPLVEDIRRSLAALIGRRNGAYGPVGMRVAGIRCQGEPVCALVVASYRVVPWST